MLSKAAPMGYVFLSVVFKRLLSNSCSRRLLLETTFKSVREARAVGQEQRREPGPTGARRGGRKRDQPLSSPREGSLDAQSVSCSFSTLRRFSAGVWSSNGEPALDCASSALEAQPACHRLQAVGHVTKHTTRTAASAPLRHEVALPWGSLSPLRPAPRGAQPQRGPFSF